MLFDIGWSEFLLVGVIALVVIGPKDLPRALRVAGYWVRKARNMSAEFQSSVEQMIRDSELDEMRQELNKVSTLDIGKELEHHIDPGGDVTKSLAPPEVPDFFEPHDAAGMNGVEPAAVATAPLLRLPPPPDEPAPALPVPEPPPVHGFDPAPEA